MMRDLPDQLEVSWLRSRSLKQLRELLIGRLEVARRARYKSEGPSDDDMLIEETLIRLLDLEAELEERRK